MAGGGLLSVEALLIIAHKLQKICTFIEDGAFPSQVGWLGLSVKVSR